MAATPVTICVFSEEIFGAFIESEGFKNELLERWSLRPSMHVLPQFSTLTSTVSEKVGRICDLTKVAAGETYHLGDDTYYLLSEGSIECEGKSYAEIGSEFGWRPIADDRVCDIKAETDATFVTFDKQAFEKLRVAVPQLNYVTRKQRITENDPSVDWILGLVDIY